MDRYRFQELLKKFSEGKITAAEKDALLTTLESLSPGELEKIYPAMSGEAIGEDLPVSAKETDVSNRAYAAVWQAVQNDEQGPKTITVKHWWLKGWVRAACIAAVTLLFSILYFQFEIRNSSARQLAQEWKEIHTLPGKRQEIMLPDGSALFVNGNSHLRYPASFTDTARELQLVTGEIFIEVAKYEKTPFVVRATNTRISVLGTSFNVRNKKIDNQVSVAVRSGKIAFEAPGLHERRLLLEAGQKAVFMESQRSFRESACSPESIAGWRKDEFIFEDASLKEILDALKDNYGFNYRIGNAAMTDKKFRAAFSGQSPLQMMRVLGRMGRFDYSIKDSTIIIP